MKLKVPYFTVTGEAQEPIVFEVNDKFSKINNNLISQAIYVEHNNTLVKPGLTKTKGNVRGGGKKPWKQKGTGRARAGSNRSPLWRGGGITFGPTADKRVLAIPKKMRETAVLSLIVNKVQENEMAVIESLKTQSAKTKDAGKILGKINNSKIVILAVDDESMANLLPWRNLALLEIKKREDISLNDLNSKKRLVFTKKAFEYVQNRAK